jgi:hypothetical protein
MLECRLVHVSLMGNNLTAKVSGDCPQGGVLPPLLWILVVDRLLTVTNDLGFSTFSYGDDIVIIVRDAKEELNISHHKTAIVPFTNRMILKGLGPLIINGKELKMLDEVKYLG